MRISDCSSDVCSSDLCLLIPPVRRRSAMTIDLSYPIVLRNDAEALHQTTVRNDAAIVDNSFDIFDIYFLAGFTRGEEKVWAECAAAELIDRQEIIEQMIERQQALRLAFLLDALVSSLKEHEVITNWRPRGWGLSVLEWDDAGDPG